MEDYKEMYYALFNRITDIIGELQSVQTEMEELFTSPEPKQIILKDRHIKDCLYLRDYTDRKML